MEDEKIESSKNNKKMEDEKRTEHKRKRYSLEDLISLAEEIKDKDLREKVIEFLKNPFPTHRDIESTNVPLEDSPASIRWHHKYKGGLIEHTLATTKIALKIADALEEVYNLNINKDVLIAGGLLHDIMKPFNYVEDIEGEKYDHIPKFHLDHLTLVVAELYKRNFPIEVIKVVASHHGEYGSMKPDSIEGWILHYADTIDAFLNDIAIKICQARAKDIGINEIEIYNLFTPLKIYEIRTREGREKLREKLSEIFNIEGEKE
ncbi:7,8-dihydroneopterin 2',3'-cyclic phosphate phosphodiesterase [Methanofervidicoccus abyssi]|uniref:7,8-dihydroneopterin 2',3'-cyclic phosphate phosphodiesterase n=2 Tax=Methanofervidicoccus abyssi TaxID=2082189 RepID=A0A401HRW9_9EURY|nr:7,8-dihydroneopterin 2',3'-cyclic phosphate phosphodiesterase [Methanofervidicoccus abyssi]